jgi:hypothetical protein
MFGAMRRLTTVRRIVASALVGSAVLAAGGATVASAESSTGSSHWAVINARGSITSSSDLMYSWYWTTGKVFVWSSNFDITKCAVSATATDYNPSGSYNLFDPATVSIGRYASGGYGYLVVEAYKVGTSTPQPVDTPIDVVAHC